MQELNGGGPLSIAEINEGDRLALAADLKAENKKHRFHLGSGPIKYLADQMIG